MEFLNNEDVDDIFRDPLGLKLWERRYIYVTEILEQFAIKKVAFF